MIVREVLQDATVRLQAALNLERQEARLEAHILAARALCVNRAWLVAHDTDTPTPDQTTSIEALVARRELGEPVAYILGEKEFYGRMFKVTPDVLIPRPETELLVEAALERLPQDRPARVLDLGTGSGCIAITLALEQPDCTVTAIDASPGALAIARANAATFNAFNCEVVAGDWNIGFDAPPFDVLVSNPPYIAEYDPHLSKGDLRHEPRSALCAVEDGLADIHRIANLTRTLLNSGGVLLVEHGYDQGEAVRTIFKTAGLVNVKTLTDIGKRDRVTLGIHT